MDRLVQVFTNSQAFGKSDWIELVSHFKNCTSKDKAEIVPVLKKAILHNPLLKASSGAELLYPVLWEYVFINRAIQLERDDAVLYILGEVVENSPYVDFGDSLPKVLLFSTRFILNEPLSDVHCALKFIAHLIKHAKKSQSLRDVDWNQILDVFADKLTQTDTNIWNYLPLVTEIILDRPVCKTLPEVSVWLRAIGTVTTGILCSRSLLQTPHRVCTILRLLTALCQYTNQSLNWLRAFCARENSGRRVTGELFTALMTVVSSELCLQLNACQAEDAQSPAENSPSSGEIQRETVGHCLRLMQLCLLEMRDDPDKVTQRLGQLLTDAAAQGIWNQLISLGQALHQRVVEPQSQVTPRAVVNWSSPRLRAPASAVYLTWLELYYSTHLSGLSHLDSDFEQRAREAQQQLSIQLVEKDLGNIGSLLRPLLVRAVDCGADDDVESSLTDCLEALGKLCALFPVPATAMVDQLMDQLWYLSSDTGDSTTLGDMATKLWSSTRGGSRLFASLVLLLNRLLLPVTLGVETTSCAAQLPSPSSAPATPHMLASSWLTEGQQLPAVLSLPDVDARVATSRLRTCLELAILATARVLVTVRRSSRNFERKHEKEVAGDRRLACTPTSASIRGDLVDPMKQYLRLVRARVLESESDESELTDSLQLLLNTVRVTAEMEPTLRELFDY